MTSFVLEIQSGSAKALPEANDLVNVLLQVDYRLVGTDGTYYAYRNRTVSFPSPDPQSFVDFSLITAELLEQWIEAADSDTITALKIAMNNELIATAEAEKAVPISLPWEAHLSNPALGLGQGSSDPSWLTLKSAN